MQQSPMDKEEFSRRERALNAKIIDRIASDRSFADALKENPRSALESAGLGEELAVLEREIPPPDEVSGQMMAGSYSTIVMCNWFSVVNACLMCGGPKYG